MRYWLRFWIFAAAVLTGLAGIGVVFTAFLFPEEFGPLGTSGYAAAFGVVGVSIGVIVWRASSEESLL